MDRRRALRNRDDRERAAAEVEWVDVGLLVVSRPRLSPFRCAATRCAVAGLTPACEPTLVAAFRFLLQHSS